MPPGSVLTVLLCPGLNIVNDGISLFNARKYGDLVVVVRVPIDSEAEWLHAMRPNYIGASEVPIVVGESMWGSLAELYAAKRGLRPSPAETPAMRRGKWLEAGVFEALAHERPEWQIRRAKVHVRCDDRRLACTPDGFAVRPGYDGIGIVQAKVVARSVFRNKWLEDPADSIEHGAATVPAHYRLQTLTEMMLNDSAWGILAVLINGEYSADLRIFEIDRDEVLEDRIAYRTAEFFDKYLDPGIMPPFEPQRDEALVRQLYPKDTGATIDLTGDNRALVAVEELTETQAARKRLESTEKALKVELQGKLGEHTYGKLADGRRLSWKLQHRNAYTAPPSDFRVLRILHSKQNKESD